MSRVVLYRCPECKRTFLDEDRFCMCSGEDREPEPVDFIPASVARGLVEALKYRRQINACQCGDSIFGSSAAVSCSECAALANAEEAMK